MGLPWAASASQSSHEDPPADHFSRLINRNHETLIPIRPDNSRAVSICIGVIIPSLSFHCSRSTKVTSTISPHHATTITDRVYLQIKTPLQDRLQLMPPSQEEMRRNAPHLQRLPTQQPGLLMARRRIPNKYQHASNAAASSPPQSSRWRPSSTPRASRHGDRIRNAKRRSRASTPDSFLAFRANVANKPDWSWSHADPGTSFPGDNGESADFELHANGCGGGFGQV